MSLRQVKSAEMDGRIARIVERQTRSGCPVASKDVVDIAWNNGRGYTYDQTNRSLSRLVKNGVLWKPTRGNYLPAEREVR